MKSGLLSTEILSGVTVLTLLMSESASAEQQSAIWEMMIRQIPSSGDVRIVLDFRNVQFLSSAGLGGLMRMAQKVRGMKGTLRLCGASPAVLELLRLTRMDRILELYGSREDALRTD